MPSLTCFNVRFTPNWFMIILALLFIGLFVRLGFWQIARADEKAKMLATEAALSRKEAVDWPTGQKFPKQYQKIRLQGHYLNDVFLLDNQHYQHQFGYDVLTPFQLADGTLIIVDRGWVQGDGGRTIFPDVSIPKGLMQLQGSAYFPSKPWVLGPGLEKKENKIIILELVDVKMISQVLQKKVSPFIIRLDKQDAHGWVREWAIVSMPPQRHLAYALQWFAMALVILILFIVLNLKKNEKNNY